MHPETVEARIQRVVCTALGAKPDELEDKTEWSRFGADSLDKVELLMMLEEEFGIEIPDKDSEKWYTYGELRAGVMKLVG